MNRNDAVALLAACTWRREKRDVRVYRKAPPRRSSWFFPGWCEWSLVHSCFELDAADSVHRLLDGGWDATLAAHDQIAADERVQIAVEHRVYVAHLDPRAQVLGNAVGLQHIGANLRTEVDVQLGVFQLLAEICFFFSSSYS